MRKPSLIFWVAVVAITCCGVIFLSAVFFFIQNQYNINQVYQGIDFSSTAAPQQTQLPIQSASPSASPSVEPVSTLSDEDMVIRKDDYIKRLSEAQNSASSRDLIALLYGVLSTVFITVGLHFLRETGQSCKRAEVVCQTVETALQNIQESSNMLMRLMSIQFHILPAANLCRSIELFFVQEQFVDSNQDIVYGYFPRIYDDLHAAEEKCIDIDIKNNVTYEMLPDLKVCIDNIVVSLENVKEAENSFIKKNPNSWIPLTSTWNNFLGYCDRILDMLDSIV